MAKRIKDMTRFELWGYENLTFISIALPSLVTDMEAEVHGPSHDIPSLRLGSDPEVLTDD